MSLVFGGEMVLSDTRTKRRYSTMTHYTQVQALVTKFAGGLDKSRDYGIMLCVKLNRIEKSVQKQKETDTY